MYRIWNPLPLNVAIIEILQKRGTSVDTELLKGLEKNFGNLSYRELNDALMRLELRGLVRISRLAKGKRNVELLERVR